MEKSEEVKSLKIAVVQAGLSTPSTTSRLADILQTTLESTARTGGLKPHTSRIDLRSLATKVTEATISGFQASEVEDALFATTQADVLIAVTPTFNASYSGIFKSFFDLVEPKALTGKVVMLGATGGTSRHSLVIEMAMRPLFSYLRAMPTPTSIFASADDFAGDSSIAERAALIAHEALSLLHLSPAAEHVAENSEAAPSHGSHRGTEPNDQEVEPTGIPLSTLNSSAGQFTPFDEIARQLSR